MVENQHRKIAGYRELSEAEIRLMNRVKEQEAATASLLREIGDAVRAEAGLPPGSQVPSSMPALSEALRQLAIARTTFEEAYMRTVRAVAKPGSPWVG